MKSGTVVFLILFAMIFSNTETKAQETPPIETGVSQKLAKWRAANYSDIRYKLNLTIEKKAPTLKGTIEISLKNKAERIILDWRKIKGSEHLSKTSNVSINGKSLILNPEQPSPPNKRPPMYSHYFEHLIFEDGVKLGENVIKIDFTSPILTSGGAITRYIDKEDGAEYIYSLFVPSDASTAFPVFDQPDLKARFYLTIFTPIDWKVITNSWNFTLLELKSGVTRSHSNFVVPEGQKLSFFLFTKPISTYVFAFAAGEFAELEDKKSSIPSKLYVRKSQVAKLKGSADGSSASSTKVRETPLPSSRVKINKATSLGRSVGGRDVRAPIEEVFRLNREAVRFFEDYFNYKFPFPKYDLVLIPEFPFGGMEHAGATFLRESSIIFPTEPTANDYISRSSLIFHEAAHQWFGDTVTMKWFDDLWLKEGFATFMAYKAMEKLLPEYDVWKVFYERTKQRAYLTDITRGTTPIYQEIPNLSAAKSAYGNIVYNKAPSFLKQAEFYLGEKEFQTAVRSFLKKHEFANAEWTDLVDEFETASKQDLKNWANVWVKKRGLPVVRLKRSSYHSYQKMGQPHDTADIYSLTQDDVLDEDGVWQMKTNVFLKFAYDGTEIKEVTLNQKERNPKDGFAKYWVDIQSNPNFKPNTPKLVFPNYKDYGYGIFLLDFRSRKYVLENIQNEKDSFLRAMMWGSLWDSVRFYELDPKDYVELVIKNLALSPAFTRQKAEQNATRTKNKKAGEKPPKGGTQNYIGKKPPKGGTQNYDDVTIASLLNRVSIAMTYYLSEKQATELAPILEKLLIDKMKNAPTLGQKITYYRAFLNTASSERAKQFLKDLLIGKSEMKDVDLKTKDKFDIVTRLIILGDADAPKLLAELEKTETSDAAKRYAYAAKAGLATKENKAKFWNDFVNNKEISESWIEEAFAVWNSPKHSELTLPYLEKALAELPDLKRNRKIFFVNGWLSEFIGGQRSEEALEIVNKFLEDNPKLDVDLRRKILENVDGLERAVKIRKKFGS